MADEADILARAKAILAEEAQALALMVETLDDDFVRAVRLALACEGRVVTTGIGKAGIIARKTSATLASTGTPSHYLHPAEAAHGDLGRVTRSDLVLALSNSGTTTELVRLIDPIKALGARLVAITADAESPLARHADAVLDYGQVREVCPLGLAPTTSTTVMLALGDALAMAVSAERDFTPEEFARYHPGGRLGRALLSVAEVMRRGERLPLLPVGSPLHEAMDRMTATPGRPGAVIVVADGGLFAGLYTDGDLRRNLLEARRGRNLDVFERSIDELMTRTPVTVSPATLVSEALRILSERKIDQVPVVDDAGRVVGLLDIQDLLDLRDVSGLSPPPSS